MTAWAFLSLFLLSWPALGADVGGASESERLTEVRVLETAPAPQQTERLLQALAGDPSVAVRAGAAKALAIPVYHSKRTLQSLERAMMSDASDSVRRQAALSALEFDGNEPVGLIDSLMHAERGEAVRRDVIAALALSPLHIKDSEATKTVALALADDPSPDVRLSAADGLGRRGDARAIGTLKIVMDKDSDKGVRRAAKRALEAIEKARASAVETKPEKPKSKQSYPAAIKGKDKCGGDAGWCECFNGPMRPSPRCMSRSACSHTFENSYRPLGYTCTWDGQIP